MDLFWYNVLLVTFTSLLFFLVFLFFKKSNVSNDRHINLPPGKMGFPFIGENLKFFKTLRNGHPENFIFERMSKFCPQVFKTSIVAEPVAVFCGIPGNKFLFSNENKCLTAWWPNSVSKIFQHKANQNENTSIEESKKTRKLLPDYLNPESLKRYISIMDSMAENHFKECWEGREQVCVHQLSKKFTFQLACNLFLSMEDSEKVKKFAVPFKILTMGLFSLPINLPGTAFNKAIKASKMIRAEITSIIKQRNIDLMEKKASPVQDILSHMLLTVDEEGNHMSESEIASKVLGLLIAGYDNASSVIKTMVYYLADNPQFYNQLYLEQMEIAKSKKPGESLNWDDLQKMRYAWNVACEAMRLLPPVAGTFRMATTDFTFGGFLIPKGWKLYWSTDASHKNPEYFPQPEKFDPSRFEGDGPIPFSFVPFGGGPRMCPGKEYARFEMLVFMHHLVKRYKWEKILSHNKTSIDPLPTANRSLPIRLFPHLP